MGVPTHRGRSEAAWSLALSQHGVVAGRQLRALGFTQKAIEHRVRVGRLHRIHRGVYAVGRRALSREGLWMAAVLACGKSSFLTHRSAGALYRICEERPGRIEVGVRVPHPLGPPRLGVRRRPSLRAEEVGTLRRIPITSPVRTLIDLATELSSKPLERAVNEADKLGVIDARSLRAGLDSRAGVPGTKRLRRLLDRDTFVLTEDELERRFLPLAREAGLPLPETGRIVNGYEVDFFWPQLRLVVETDGLRYHRTPATQARDAQRDAVHTAAGHARLRFTHWQVRHEPDWVKGILRETTARLAPAAERRHADRAALRSSRPPAGQ